MKIAPILSKWQQAMMMESQDIQRQMFDVQDQSSIQRQVSDAQDLRIFLPHYPRGGEVIGFKS